MIHCRTGRHEYCSEVWCIRNGACQVHEKPAEESNDMKRMIIKMYNNGEKGGELFGFELAGDDVERIVQEGIEVLELMKKREVKD